jgi:hypothetical protein
MEGGSTNSEMAYQTGSYVQPYDHRQIILGVFVFISAYLPIIATTSSLNCCRVDSGFGFGLCVSMSVSMAEEKFNNFSLEERGKFDEETLVTVNTWGKRMMMMGAPQSGRFKNE